MSLRPSANGGVMRSLLLAAVLAAGCGGNGGPTQPLEKREPRSDTKEPQAVGSSATVTPEAVPLETIAAAYQSDPNTGDAKYKGKRLRVSATVRHVGEGWVSSYAALSQPKFTAGSIGSAQRKAQEAALAGFPKNVVFLGATGAAADKDHVIEGTCDGVTDAPKVGPKLTFSDCKIVK